jgi:glucose-1-phosphate thymidylyltransferase
MMQEITTEEVIFVVGYKGEQIEAWIREHYSHLDAHFVVQEEALGQAHAVWLCHNYLDDGDVAVAFGDGIFDTDYQNLANQEADAVLLVQEVADPRRFGVAVLDREGYVKELIEKSSTMEHRIGIAGVMWFRSGRILYEAIDTIIQQNRQTLGEYFMVDAYQVMLEQGSKFRTVNLSLWADAGTPQSILKTNGVLLSRGCDTPGAVEWGIEVQFVVIPPVYLHPTAVIESAVIGPYATFEADVKITSSVIRNSIIDAGAQLDHCLVKDSLIGENAYACGRVKSIFVGDDSIVKV